ncbi:MAG TPA: hypothetical protein ENJ08_00880 [Gammaproteobacteria bacterium]|nr:hypothetical protein [Gammaproteobacteria bacterium]
MFSLIDNIKQIMLLLIPGIVCFFISSGAYAEEQSTEQFINQWLQNSCEIGDEGIKTAKVLSIYGMTGEKFLLNAFESGPDEKQLVEFRQSREKNWMKRQALVDSEKIKALSKNDAEIVKNTSRDEYIKRQIDLYKKRYQDRALQGLAIVGTIKSQKILENYIKNDKALLKEQAIKTLNIIKKRNKL